MKPFFIIILYNNENGLNKFILIKKAIVEV